MNRLAQFGLILVIYLVIDIAYQVAFGLQFMGGLFEAAGIRGVMAEQPNHPWTILLFFLMIAFVLLKVAVEPAIEKSDYKLAIHNGFLVGVAAYGTTGCVFLWSIAGYPLLAVAAVLFEGIVFCSISSGLTAYLALRRARN